MKVFAGTSGFAYKEWKGAFYPADLPNDAMLRFYASRLPAVEINNTFYRLPKRSVLEAWGADVPAEFRFVLKASRRITHLKRLAGVEDETAYLIETARVLGARLGAILWQLPPNLKKDLPRLAGFLALLPADVRAAFEFRHASWQDDETYALLRERGAALVVADSEDGVDAPLLASAPFGYVRLRRADYDEEQLAAWAARLAGLGWEEVFVFFKHEDEAGGPALAARFLALAASR